jgi:hypothetical protein
MNRQRVIKPLIHLFLITCIMCSAGCASIVSKSQYPVTIQSNPTGASVTIKNKQGVDVQKATTPTTVTLPAKAGFFTPANYSFQFEKEGYLPASSSLSASMDPWYIGNIIFGGLIGILIVDPATGAMWKLNDAICGNLSADPSYHAVEPHKAISTTSTATKKLGASQSVRDYLQRLNELKESGVLTEDEYETKRKDFAGKLFQRIKDLKDSGALTEDEYETKRKALVDILL